MSPFDYGAIEALGLSKNKAAVDSLLSILSQADSAVDSYAEQCALIALGRIGDARSSAVVASHLGDDNIGVRHAASWALGRIGDKQSADFLAPYLDSENWRYVAWAMGELQDPRAVDRLVDFFREQPYFIIHGSAPRPTVSTHNALYAIYTNSREAYYPQGPSDVMGVTAFVIEDLLVQIGTSAKARLIAALNHGGIGNDMLAYPLRRLSWNPANDTEWFFFHISDPDKSVQELWETFLEPVRELKAINSETLIRSLPTLSGPNYSFGVFLSSMVKDGLLPIWDELIDKDKYDQRTARALRNFCEQMLQDRNLEISLRSSIEQALSN